MEALNVNHGIDDVITRTHIKQTHFSQLVKESFSKKKNTKKHKKTQTKQRRRRQEAFNNSQNLHLKAKQNKQKLELLRMRTKVLWEHLHREREIFNEYYGKRPSDRWAAWCVGKIKYYDSITAKLHADR